MIIKSQLLINNNIFSNKVFEVCITFIIITFTIHMKPTFLEYRTIFLHVDAITIFVSTFIPSNIYFWMLSLSSKSIWPALGWLHKPFEKKFAFKSICSYKSIRLAFLIHLSYKDPFFIVTPIKIVKCKSNRMFRWLKTTFTQ